ncbi:MAG: DUF2384 domain-containing protein [Alphaproteobacteria bacterium]|jgi:hypothetical protein|nr:DUF2384 domain-containing protein [Alphaproteobacteria bacterium]MBT5390025.1 DUF2384 domain-containing protein [Alphaproteobacteria bacterium]MBT5654208.1 DUF2384 domain-containing protein [Alphaproteobacteria bacterium]
MVDTSTSQEINRRDLARPALDAFFNIANLWHLDTEQQMNLLGLESRSTFFKWKKEKNGLLSKDTLERISYILGIYKALQILFPNPSIADEWIHKSNTAFDEKSALDRMLSGNVVDLFEVRQYLDAQRGGWS